MLRHAAWVLSALVLATVALAPAAGTTEVWEARTVLVELAPADTAAEIASWPREILVTDIPAPWHAPLVDAGAVALRRIASVFDPYVRDARGTPMIRADGEPMRVPHDLTRWFRVSLAHDDVENAVRLLARSPFVVACEPNYLRTADGLAPPRPAGGPKAARASVPGDPLFSPAQWGLDNWGQYGGTPGYDLNVRDAWDTYGDAHEPVRVAVLDSGVDPAHPDLPAIEMGCNAVGSGPPIDDDTATWQGTASAGIIAMQGGNGQGGVGLDGAITAVACKIRSGTSAPTAADIAECVEWCRYELIPIINIGYGATTSSMVEKRAIRNARSTGLAVVVSSGNDNSGAPRYPAAYANHALTVGAFVPTGDRWVDANLCGLESSALGSSYGAWLDLTAPGGRGIATTRQHSVGGGYYDLDIEAWQTCAGGSLDWSEVDGFGGTAASCAYVSGTLAAVMATNPELTGEDAQEIILRTSEDHQLPVRGWDAEFGWGRPNLEEALRLASPPYTVWHGTTFGGVSIDDGSGMALFIDVEDLPDGHYGFQRFRVEKTVSIDHTFTGTPMGWGVVRGTSGWRRIDDGSVYVATDESLGWCKVIALSMTEATVRTYEYKLFAPDGRLVGTFPDDGQSTMVFSVLGPSLILDAPEDGPQAASTPRAVPNPAREAVRFAFGRGTDRNGSGAFATVYDAAGKAVRRLSLGTLGDGHWNLLDNAGRRVAPGAYFVGAEKRPKNFVRVLVTR